MSSRQLTKKERWFVAYYLGEARGNATKAAIMAGYKNPRGIAPGLCAKPSIAQAIEEGVSRVEMGQQEVLMRLAELARTDMTDFLRFPSLEGPAALDMHKAKRRGKLGGIKKLKASRIDRGDDQDPLDVVEVELHSPIEALKLLAKYHKLIDTAKENNETKNRKPISEALDLLRARQRERARSEPGEGAVSRPLGSVP